MTLRYDTISFMSDYGRDDEFVGVVHSVIRQLAPGVQVIDITHEVPRFDVRAGGLTLGRCAQYLAPGVVVAVVDPGVGSERRGVAVEVGGGQSVLVGPDNGVLAAAVAVAGGATRAVWLNNPDYQLSSAGALFDGRDVFAPAAAHLCNGVPLEELGEVISTASLLPGTLPIPEQTEDGLRCEVLWIDHFGNVQLNVSPQEADALGEAFRVIVDDASRLVHKVANFSEVGVGAIGLVVDSYGALALVCNQASAAGELSLDVGDSLFLATLEEDDQSAVGQSGPVATPVRLGTSAGEKQP